MYRTRMVPAQRIHPPRNGIKLKMNTCERCQLDKGIGIKLNGTCLIKCQLGNNLK